MASRSTVLIAILAVALAGLGGLKACGPPVTATLETPASPTASKLPVTFVLTASSAEAASITLSYSTDGGLTYKPATTSGPTSGLATSATGITHVISWDSLADLGKAKATVILKLVPKSGYDEGESATSGPFLVDNTAGPANLAPSAVLLDPKGGTADTYHGHLALNYKLSDPEGDSSTIAVEYSTDGGATYVAATPLSGTPTSGLEAPKSWKSHSFAWDSLADLGKTKAVVLLKLTPADADTGSPAVSGSLAIDNTTLLNERGPYLQNVTPTSILVVWTTEQKTTTKVDFGTTPELGMTYESTGNTTLHAAELTGLTPDTHYHYTASSSGVTIASAKFRTTPPPGSTFSFIAFGDCGTGSSSQYAVAKLMEAKKLTADLALVLGDLVYPRGEQKDYTSKFFKPYKGLLPSLVTYVTIGNHDIASDAKGLPLLENFYLPSNNPLEVERYYSFDYGDVHFVSLDCTLPVTPDSPQGKWFAADLAKSTAPWKIVYQHFTVYSSGWHGSNAGLKASLTPVMISSGVDLMLSGHDHHYERSKSIDGITYIVSGGGGTGLRSIWAKGSFSKVAEKKHHFTYFTVSPTKLSMVAIDKTGAVIDTFSLTK